MKSFREFIDEERLDEGLVRAGAIATYAAASRRAGDKSVQAWQSGKRVLSNKAVKQSDEERQARLEAALVALFDGLIHQREQIGYGVAVDAVGHMMTARSLKRSRRSNKRR